MSISEDEVKKTGAVCQKLVQSATTYSDWGVGAHPGIAGPLNELITWILVSRSLLKKLTNAATGRVDSDLEQLKDLKKTIESIKALAEVIQPASLPDVVEKELFRDGAKALEPFRDAIAFDAAVALKVLSTHRDAIGKLARTKDWAGLSAVVSELITSGLATACGAEIVKTIHDLFDDFGARKKQAKGGSDLLDLGDALRPLYSGWCIQVQCQIYRLRSQHGGLTPVQFGEQAMKDVLAEYEFLWKLGQGFLRI